MKYLSIFILFLVIGFSITAIYRYFNFQQNLLNYQTLGITTKYSLINAPEESFKGNIASMSGTILWFSRIAKKPIRLTSPRSIQQGEELITGNKSNAEILINDSVEVTLNSNSDVNFIQTLPINIVLLQNKGTVLYQNLGQHALSVDTLDLISAINSASTKITVNPSAKIVTVSVQKGTITEGYEDLQDNSNVNIVQAGQTFQFNDDTKEVTLQGNPIQVNSPF